MMECIVTSDNWRDILKYQQMLIPSDCNAWATMHEIVWCFVYTDLSNPITEVVSTQTLGVMDCLVFFVLNIIEDEHEN